MMVNPEINKHRLKLFANLQTSLTIEEYPSTSKPKEYTGQAKRLRSSIPEGGEPYYFFIIMTLF
jgi:hypothetical protein